MAVRCCPKQLDRTLPFIRYFIALRPQGELSADASQGHTVRRARFHTVKRQLQQMGAVLNDQVFADGIGQISVIGATVRVDLVTYSPVEKDPGGRPAAVFRQQIIMSADAFLHAAEKIQEAANTLSSRVAALRPQGGPAVVEPVTSPARPEPIAATVDAPKVEGKPPFP